MILTISHDLDILSQFMSHTPFVIYALIATLLIFLAYVISISIDEFYLKLLLPVIYVCLLGFGAFYYWDNLVEMLSIVRHDFSFHGITLGMMPYFIGLGTFMAMTFISMFLKKVSIMSKIIHITAFSILQFLFFCMIYLFITIEPSFSSVTEVYQHDVIVAILNCSSLIVISWFSILIITTLSKMIYHISDDEDIETFDTFSVKSEDEINRELKQRIYSMTEEIARLKEQSERDKLMMQTRIQAIEDSLGKTNHYFLSQLEEVSEQIEHDVTLDYMKELEAMMEENYHIVTTELQSLRRKPEMEIQELKQKLERLEDMVFDTNQRIMQQLKLLKVTPEYEIEKVKDEISHLEILLKRYINDINHELVQTKKEFEVAKSRRYRQYNAGMK